MTNTDTWISVEERLPEPGQRVLVFEALYAEQEVRGYVGPCNNTVTHIWSDNDGHEYIEYYSHWQPLPPPPCVCKED